MAKKKNKIKIKPSKKGTFTKAAKKRGKGVQSFASQVLANKERYSPAMVKKANFARNASKWKHEDGGIVQYQQGGSVVPLSAYQLRDEALPQFNTNYQFSGQDPYGMYNNNSFELQSSGNYNALQNYNNVPNNQQITGGNANSGWSGINNMLDFGQQGNFNNTQYGDYNASGGMAAAGVVGSVGSSLIDQYGKDANQQKYTDSGSSWSQDLVGSSGPWGAAISGVSQLGESALETGVDYNDYGVAENQTYNQIAGSLETGLLDPAQNLDVALSSDYSTGERIGSALLPGLAGIFQADKEQEDAKQRQNEARQLENKRRRALREQQGADVTYKPTLTYANGGAINSGPEREIVDIYTKLNNDWMNNPNYKGGNLQRYNEPTYVGYKGNGANNVLDSTQFSQDPNFGPKATFYRTYKDTTTGTDYTVPVFDSEVYGKTFPESKQTGNTTGYRNLGTFAKGGKTHTMPNGEVMPGAYHGDPNAELEEDEVFRTPNGDIEEVPEDTPTHKEGGIKMTLPEGTEILGKMKGKYKDKTYKQLGQDLKDKYDKYNKKLEDSTSVLTEKSIQKMLDKIQYEFDSLWTDQEVQKSLQKYHSKEQKMQGVPQEYAPMEPTMESEYTEPQYAKGGKIRKYEDGGWVDWLSNLDLTDEELNAVIAGFKAQANSDNPISGQYSTDEEEIRNLINDFRNNPDKIGTSYRPGGWNTLPALYSYYMREGADSFKPSNTTQGQSMNKLEAIPPVRQPDSSLRENYITYSPSEQQDMLRGARRDRRQGITGDLTGTLGTAAQFAPAAYNLYQGMFGNEQYLNAQDYMNPYRNRITADLADMRYNIRPELEANELAYQTARRNVRQVAPGVGNLLSNYGALSGSRMRADASAYARKQNMENQYRMQRAGTLTNLGAQSAQTKLGVDQYNAQVDAAKQNALSTGIDQLAGAAYNIGKTKNIRNRDALLGAALQQYASKYNLDPSDPNTFLSFIGTTQGQ